MLVARPSDENLKKVVEAAREAKADFLLGVGGGSKIDLAKMAAKELGLEFLSVPTSASHDGIASGRASIRNNKGPVSMDAKVPLGVVADTARHRTITIPFAGLGLRGRHIQLNGADGLGVRQAPAQRELQPFRLRAGELYGARP